MMDDECPMSDPEEAARFMIVVACIKYFLVRTRGHLQNLILRSFQQQYGHNFLNVIAATIRFMFDAKKMDKIHYDALSELVTEAQNDIRSILLKSFWVCSIRHQLFQI
jgi:hypothetical protein